MIHPGGRPTTDFVFQAGRFEPDHEVLEVGCGDGRTAVRLATEKGCRVTAIDIPRRPDPFVLHSPRGKELDQGSMFYAWREVRAARLVAEPQPDPMAKPDDGLQEPISALFVPRGVPWALAEG